MTRYFNFEKISRTFSYEEYKDYVNNLVQNAQTSGPDQSGDKIELTRLNESRIQRIEKKCNLNVEVARYLENLECPQNWYLLMEAWCGDGSENLPVIANMAAQSPQVELKILLRDENPAIMDQYLTNGSRSIPKLISVEGLTGRELWTWGPRPTPIQEKVLQLKKYSPGLPSPEFKKQLHKWYARDKCRSLQREFGKLVTSN